MGAVVLHLAVLAIALFNPQEKNEAEALLRKMEDKLSDAKTLQIRIEGTSKSSKGPVTMKSTLYLEGAKRLRMEMEVQSGTDKTSFLAVSDGSNLKTSGKTDLSNDKSNGPYQNDTPMILNIPLVHALIRTEIELCASWLEATADRNAPIERRRMPDYQNSKMGKREKIGNRNAQRVHFTSFGRGNPVSVTLWIDVETTLPIKRELRGMQGVEDVTTIETFSEVKLDEKIDPAKFELSKEKK